MSSNKKYWKNVEELDPKYSEVVDTFRQKEFVEEIPVDEFLGDKENLEASSTTRRDFLKYVGFSTAAASLAACEGPVVKSIPYVVQPEEIVPGVANFYASVVADGYDFASVLVKTREGRPIQIGNNKLAGDHGFANARVQASVLGVYDSLRLQGPMRGEDQISWMEFDADVKAGIESAAASGKEVVLLTQTFASPSTYQLINDFSAKYANVKHVTYDAVSEYAANAAYKAKYGKMGMANYDFSKAMMVVSVGADFIGDWQGGGFEAGYAKARVPKDGKMSRHVQFESNMSLAGANADKRVPVRPSEQHIVLAKLYGKITGNAVGGSLPEKVEDAVNKAASQLLRHGSNAVVVTGIQDVKAQSLVLAINEALQSKAFMPEKPILTRQGNPDAVNQLVTDMNAGKVGALIMCGVNPMYSLPNAADFKTGLEKVTMSVAFSMKADETSSNATLVGALSHSLESWGDLEMVEGMYATMQPTIRPLFDTKQFQEFLMAMNGEQESYSEYLQHYWETSILSGTSWQEAVRDGVYMSATSANAETESTDDTEEDAVNESASVMARALASTTVSTGYELTLYPKTGMGDGQQANNPWLQEFPDPMTRTTWDNYLTMSEADAKELGLYLDPSTFFTQSRNDATGGLNGKYANVTVNGVTVENVPVIIQPGQAKGTVGLSYGYGRTAGLKEEMQVGVNAYPLYQGFNPNQEISISAAPGKHEFACIQLQNTLMGRGDVIKETTLEIFNTKDKDYWNAIPVVSLDHEETPVTDSRVDLWDEFDRSIGHHFNLSIDLNSCTGCGACVVACHIENNVPVVGKEEIRRSRDMHWLRIDRYYSSNDTFEGDDQQKEDMSGLFGENGSLSGFREMENPAENPQVAFQPIMCQHCNHAPCETVCPVAASSHGRQGQNHMAYNRCVGTRYCANNCPYKVRRFNWFKYNGNDEFDYHMNDDLGRMVINPDVTVRSRGVMEKCSMCIQMTQKTILDAKRDGRVIEAGEFKTACSAACSTGAIVFGDINNPEDEVTKLKDDDRMYRLLAAVGTKPNVMYQTKVRNTTEA
ncbi:MAG: TAT-variant-translocated molybdopterin oxidoreductase [bacterium]